MDTPNSELKTWQTGPAALIKYAIRYLDYSSDLERKIGFLLLDCGVEELLKTYLELPDELSGSTVDYEERKPALKSQSFIQVVRTANKAAKDKLKGIDLMDILHYHERRNSLYHRGSGITIEDEVFRKYASLVAEVLFQLFGVDIRDQLTIRQQRIKIHEEMGNKRLELSLNITKLNSLMERLDDLLLVAYGKVNPAFAESAFWEEISRWRNTFDADSIITFYKLLKSYSTNERGDQDTSYTSDIEELLPNEDIFEKALQIAPNFYQKMPIELMRLTEQFDIPAVYIFHAVEEGITGMLLSLGMYVFSLSLDQVSAYRSADMVVRDPNGERFMIYDGDALEIDNIELSLLESQDALQSLQNLVDVVRKLAGLL